VPDRFQELIRPCLEHWGFSWYQTEPSLANLTLTPIKDFLGQTPVRGAGCFTALYTIQDKTHPPGFASFDLPGFVRPSSAIQSHDLLLSPLWYHSDLLQEAECDHPRLVISHCPREAFEE